MSYDILKIMFFPYIFYVKDQVLTPAIENVWESHDF